MKLPVFIQLDGVKAEYLISKLDGKYTATLNEASADPSFIIPPQIGLHKKDGEWVYDHVLGIVIADAIDSHESGRLK
jgi:hypothetical protein